MRRRTLFVVFLSLLALGCFSIKDPAQAGGPGHKEVTTSPGVPIKVATHGKIADPRTFSLKITKRPSHGTLNFKKTPSGASQVIYQSKKGYVGRDDFAYVRVGSDSFAGTYTVAVTVK